jgi:hypothetical protein
MDLFGKWRTEIEQQLANAEVLLVGCEAELKEATIEAREANIGRTELADAFSKLRGQVATALQNRRVGRDEELKQKAARVAVAISSVKNCKYTIADLEQALRQLDEIAPAEEPAEAA